jgi:glyoxylase-like metal-dependent hydrolase (beta-lactamase superfamily II)
MNRRTFIANGGASFALAALEGTAFVGHSPIVPQYEQISEHVGIFRDVVNVGIIKKNKKVLLIDCGEGTFLESTDPQIYGTLEQVLFTHYHRDQCAGATKLRKTGAQVLVPASEAELFSRATEFWKNADRILYDRMDFRPEAFVLRESVPVDGTVAPGDRLVWQGIPIRVIATPGHTDGSVSYLFDIDGTAIAFCGDLLYGPGQLWEFYSLQKAFPFMPGGYWGFGGGVASLLESARQLIALNPRILIPSHGAVIKDPSAAVDLLDKRLNAVMRNYLSLAAWRISPRHIPDSGEIHGIPMLPPLPTVDLPPWLYRVEKGNTSYYIVDENKSIFLFDCGFPSIVNAIDKLAAVGTMMRIDGIWASHYHDDHVTSINTIRRRYGGKVFIQRELRDIFENPLAYSMPALFPESIHIDHALEEGEAFDWNGYRLTSYYFPGQTVYHDGLLIEHDGIRVFMTGDSFANWGIDDYCIYNRNFVGKDGELAGYKRCIRLLQQLKPDLICTAHWGPRPISHEYLQRTLDLLTERDTMWAALFPWEDPNFALDPSWIRAYPYRQSVLPGAHVTLEARIYNHSDVQQQAMVELRLPEGWGAINTIRSAIIAPHSEGTIRLASHAPQNPTARRQVLGIAARFGDHNLGEFAEAIVDYLGTD